MKLCPDCGGSGNYVHFKDKIRWTICPICQGTGVVITQTEENPIE